MIPYVVVLLGSQLANFSLCMRIKQVGVMVFDEDASVLNAETESSVTQLIDDLADELNAIMITHRTAKLKNLI